MYVCLSVCKCVYLSIGAHGGQWCKIPGAETTGDCKHPDTGTKLDSGALQELNRTQRTLTRAHNYFCS